MISVLLSHPLLGLFIVVTFKTTCFGQYFIFSIAFVVQVSFTSLGLKTYSKFLNSNCLMCNCEGLM